MQVSCIDVGLLNMVTSLSSDSKESTNGCEFGNGGESVVEVLSFSLSEALGDEASLLLDDFTCRISLMLENPFTANGTGTRR
jgi:hypothetical protein